MRQYFPKDVLHQLRNQIPVKDLLAHLHWPRKQRDGRFRFLCPQCRELVATINPRANLGRCFHCEENFNPIDLVMLINHYDFVEAVHFLQELLPPTSPTTVAAK